MKKTLIIYDASDIVKFHKHKSSSQKDFINAVGSELLGVEKKAEGKMDNSLLRYHEFVSGIDVIHFVYMEDVLRLRFFDTSDTILKTEQYSSIVQYSHHSSPIDIKRAGMLRKLFDADTNYVDFFPTIEKYKEYRGVVANSEPKEETVKYEIFTRPMWDEYFMNIVDDVKKRSSCLSRKVGSVIVDKNNRTVSTGYNGAPSGLRHCIEVGCYRRKNKIPSGEKLEMCRGLHAEQNAILYTDKDLKGCTIYVSCSPCVTCAKLIISRGIERVVYRDIYDNDLAFEILNEAGIEVVKYKEATK